MGGGGQSFVTSFWGGQSFVTSCDEGGVKNRPKKRDVIYGRPLCTYLYISRGWF